MAQKLRSVAVRHRSLVLACFAFAALAPPATAAELTRVASSFEKNDPFGLLLDFAFDYTRDTGKLFREWYEASGATTVSELNYARFESRLAIDARIGLFRDVELHIGVPIVFQQDRYWSFADGTNETNTTLYRNCIDATGAGCVTPGRGDGRLFTVGNPQSASFRSGLGNFVFGLAWAPFNNKKDDTKPTWVLRFDYAAPTSSTLNPSLATSTSMRGTIGDRTHRYTFSTSLSKRIGVADPYFMVHYTLPWVGPMAYSNCQNQSDARMARASNCNDPRWNADQSGLRPTHTGGVVFGTELNLYERPDRFQRVVFDVRAFATYVSEGRIYNELSDLTGKLHTQSDYAHVGGHVALIGQAAEFVQLRALVSAAYNTERFLTTEALGRDLDNSGAIEVSTKPEEINPNFDFRVDRTGRRFRMQEQFILNLLITATFNF
jgi:hypothetical protein